MIHAPCKDCEFRHFGCHANCEIYAEWAKEAREESIATSKNKAALSAMWNYGKWRKVK